MEKLWLSAHIYYSEPFDTLLTKGVKPFIENLKLEKLVENYFFIRYWEGGPHIRLRIKGKSIKHIEQIKICLVKTFNEFLNDYPSQRKEPKSSKLLPIVQKWYPNNTIQFIRYEPETARYGGKHTLLLAEEQFRYSSDAVLQLMATEKNWNYERVLGSALQLHLSFAHAIGLNIAQVEAFFSRVFLEWLPRAYYLISSSEKQQQKNKKIMAAFNKNFERQKNLLLPFIFTLWEQLEREQPFDETWLNEWIKRMKIIENKFIEKQKNGLLITPHPVNLKAKMDSENRSMIERWGVYYSFIHMTNNRLGVLNRDEGYLGYLLKEGLKR